LAVQERETSRQLLFDEEDRLCGRCIVRAAGAEFPEIEWAQPAPHVYALAFAGIHVLSPLIFEKMEEQGAFSIIDAYLNLASQGEKIVAFWADEYYWRDLGRPDDLLQAAQDMSSGKYSEI
jgi:NDP-sugar pyrophosphorylase family protein